MERTKKCERCNTENEGYRSYCKKCGHFLLSNQDLQSGIKKVTIWDVQNKKSEVASKQDVHPKEILEEHVICPTCGNREIVVNGELPWNCGVCGYFYQRGVDLIRSGDTKRNTNSENAITKEDVAISVKPKNPMMRRVTDQSSMRLIICTRKDVLPEEVLARGAIVGYQGLFGDIISGKNQWRIWHCESGWYGSAMMGQTYFNGEETVNGAQIKLSDGDMFTFGEESIRVEII
ncbi:MAG: hypothetical protein ACOX1S_03970 [Anaerostipes sp.]|jgi:ribosomal protein S27AE